jgi:hypothetical protein
MDIQVLPDDELLAQATEWRQRSLRGEKDARGLAHELEREARRRFGVPKSETPLTLPAVRLLAVLPATSQRRWRW